MMITKKIHTDLSVWKDSKIEDLLNSDEMNSDGQNQSNIDDVNKTTQNLTIADIKRLAESSLNTDFDESQVNSIIIKDSNYLEWLNEEEKYEPEDDSNGLKKIYKISEAN